MFVQQLSDGVLSTMSDLIVGTIIGLLSSASFALQNVIIGGQKDNVSALIANSIKMWIALPFMVVLVIVPWRIHEFLLPNSVLLPLVISILLGGAFGDGIYLSSQERIGVSRAFPIANTYPIITYLAALFMLGDVLRLTTIAGIVLAVLGVILVAREMEVDESEDTQQSRDWRGLVLALISSIMLAFATIFMDIGVAEIDPFDANLFRMAIGSIAMVPIFSVSYRQRKKPLTGRTVKIVAVAGFFGMGLASLLYIASIKLVGATIGAVLGSTSPLFALPFSVFYLREKITWKGVLGTIATIAGIWLVLIHV